MPCTTPLASTDVLDRSMATIPDATNRPEGSLWTGTVHRAGCSVLGARGGTIEPTYSQLRPLPPNEPPQTGKCCGGDGKPFQPPTSVETDVGCFDWEREHGPHTWRDAIDNRVRKRPGWGQG
jgi:hypothetical protein